MTTKQLIDGSEGERLLRRVSQVRQKAKAKQKLDVVESRQLPLWGETERGLPSSLARGALFTAAKNTNGESREFLMDKRVSTLSNIKLEYRGQELRQDDASVFMTLLHLGRHTTLGEPIYFTAYSMLKELGWSINSVEYAHLRECCSRLATTTVTVSTTDDTEGFGGSLVRLFRWKNDKTGEMLPHWWVHLEPDIAQLFLENTFTMLEWGERKKIGGRSPLALWLHSYLGTHKEPYAMSVEKYHELSASRCKGMGDFRRRLKQALQRLVDVKFLHSFSLENDLVEVKRVPKHFPTPTRIPKAGTAPSLPAPDVELVA